ncbi:MAG: DNA-directed RNA polymerase subunit omega [Acidobacteria bacterium]|nr:MAG: DNA-directed RNA polymerase subunit omega [Acidobacteriota bacterium]TDI12360.1 MAG: DNA-directed RNA polymerase subunit omega [Acidobacteriota bacterium]TDI16971.1 MAG: DNA-directed RNA polymerase subunit omega [Acidobacteriota bacterium]
MTVKIPEEFDSKFRFILVAAARAKQLQHGAPPRIKTQAKKPATIAVLEVEQNLVPYVILKPGEKEKE